jgi:hypothetical protein
VAFVSKARASAAFYTAVLVAVEVLVQGLALLDADRNPWVPAAQLASYLVGLAASVAFWALYRPPAGPPRLFRWFLLLMALLWVVEIGRRLATGAEASILWVAPALLLIMLWTKPPDSGGARETADTVGWIFIGAVAVSVLLESAGVFRSWYEVYEVSATTPGGDRAAYWLPFASALGLDGRWAGPFFHPNHAGPVGAFLLVLGLCRTGSLRWATLGTGAGVLLLTASRTSMLAAVAGCAAVAAAWWLRRESRWPRWAKAIAIAVPVVGLALVVIGDNWGFTGRTVIWPVYANLWMESPLVGIPDARIGEAVATGALPGWAATAHNLLLDSLVRFGIAGTAVVVAALVVAAILSVRAAARGAYLSLGLMAVILVCGVTEALLVWRALATSTIILVVAVIASLEKPDEST